MVPPQPRRSTGLLFLFSPFIYIASAQFAGAVTTTTHLAPSHPRECTYLGWTSIICRGHLPLVKTMRANNVERLETDANGRNQLGSGQGRSCQMILHHIRWISDIRSDLAIRDKDQIRSILISDDDKSSDNSSDLVGSGPKQIPIRIVKGRVDEGFQEEE